ARIRGCEFAPSPRSHRRLCRNDENAAFVILNEVKNLMDSIRYTTQILRLPPQNDITTQSLKGEEAGTEEKHMDIRYGLISADSHVVTDKDAFVKRMSKPKWGDRVPQLMEVESKGRLVHRWVVNAKSLGGRGVCTWPAVRGDPLRSSYPQRWEDVPAKAYVPSERLKALDADGIDAEVLFPNDPGSFHQYNDAEFELSCVQAYNDSMAEWYRASDRFIPLAMVPILGGMDAAVAEIERAAIMGHRGIVMLALPSLLLKELPHISDAYWYPLWEACQDAELPIHLHASAGLARKITFPEWEGYSPY